MINMRLYRIYKEGKGRGFITSTYAEWRSEVEQRMHIMYKIPWKEYSDEEILSFMEGEKFNEWERNRQRE